MKLALDHNDIKHGFMVGRAARMADWAFKREQEEFERTLSVLRAKKWRKENPERARKNARTYAKRHAVKLVVHVRRWRHRRARKAATVYTCRNPECGVQWCRVPFGRPNGNNRPTYCSATCCNRARYLRGLAGGWAWRAIEAKRAARRAGERRAA